MFNVGWPSCFAHPFQYLSYFVHIFYLTTIPQQGQKDFAIILAKIRDTAIFNRLYIKLYIKFVANNGKNRDSVHAAISFCPWYALSGWGSLTKYGALCIAPRCQAQLPKSADNPEMYKL